MGSQLSFTWDAEYNARKKLLVTGADNYIGACMVQKALSEGFDVWAGIAPDTSHEGFDENDSLHVIELNLADETALRRQFDEFKRSEESWEVVIHCAGITHSADAGDYHRVNFLQTRHLVDSLVEGHMTPRQFIFISALDACGLLHEEEPHVPFTDEDVPSPATHYGSSMLCAEDYLRDQERFPYLILRPAVLCGTGCMNHLHTVRTILDGFDIRWGRRRQSLTFLCVSDLAKAVFLAIEKDVTERTLFVTDGQTYNVHDLADCIRHALGIGFVVRLTLPLALCRLICSIGEWWGRVRKVETYYDHERLLALTQRNRLCDTTFLSDELGFKPDSTLQQGINDTVNWYRSQGLIGGIAANNEQ